MNPVSRVFTKTVGHAYRPGQRVICILGAANRDPKASPDPDRMYKSRSAASHFALLMGIHHSLGTPLARLDGLVAFEALRPRMEGIRLAKGPKYREQVTLRGLESLWPEAAWRVPHTGSRDSCRP